jgi:hypothetical protein
MNTLDNFVRTFVRQNGLKNGLAFAKETKSGYTVNFYALKLNKVELTSVLRAVCKIKIAVSLVLSAAKEDERIKAVKGTVSCRAFNAMLSSNYVAYVNNRGELIDKGTFTVPENFRKSTHFTAHAETLIAKALPNATRNGKIDFSNAELVCVIDKIIAANVAVCEYQQKAVNAMNNTIRAINAQDTKPETKPETETAKVA